MNESEKKKKYTLIEKKCLEIVRIILERGLKKN